MLVKTLQCHNLLVHVLCYSADALDTGRAIIHQSKQLSSFVLQMGPTLARVTHLHLNLPSSLSSDECDVEAAAFLKTPLLSLAASFPRLVQLAVCGRVGSSFLQSFGSLCPQLSSFYAAFKSLTSTTIQQLPTLLPHLTSLGVLPATPFEYDQSKPRISEARHSCADKEQSNEAVCNVLKACPNLLHLDTTSYSLTAEVWAALPLKILSCTTTGMELSHDGGPEPTWQQHTCINSLTFSGHAVTVEDFGHLLQGAPHLSKITMQSCTLFYMSYFTELDRFPEVLSIVNARLEAGLQLCKEGSGILKITRVAEPAMLVYITSMDNNSTILSSSLPASPKFTKLKVRDMGCTARVDISQVPRLFPNLRRVVFKGNAFHSGAIQVLAACFGLRSVEMRSCKGVTFSDVGALCMASASLRNLTCRCCKDISVRDGRMMQRQGWGGRVKVFVEHALDVGKRVC